MIEYNRINLEHKGDYEVSNKITS